MKLKKQFWQKVFVRSRKKKYISLIKSNSINAFQLYFGAESTIFDYTLHPILSSLRICTLYHIKLIFYAFAGKKHVKLLIISILEECLKGYNKYLKFAKHYIIIDILQQKLIYLQQTEQNPISVIFDSHLLFVCVFFH